MKVKIISFVMLLFALVRAEDKTILTIYEQSRAWVQDVRACDLPDGRGTLVLGQVPGNLNPESVLLQSQTAGQKFAVLEQVFLNPAANSDALYQAYEGQPVQIVTENGIGVSGTLVQSGSGEKVLEDDQGHLIVVQNNRIDHIILPPFSELVRKPYLEFQINNQGPLKQPLVLNYMTEALGWSADYNAELSGDEKTISISGDVSITNYAGMDYQEATVILMSGDVQFQAKKLRGTGAPMMAKAMVMSESATYDAADESVFEYHQYRLPFPVRLHNGETRQFHFVQPHTFHVDKKYLYESNQNAEKVSTALIGKNTLGMALPKGVVRIFQTQKDQPSLFIGEDQIAHVPEKAEIRFVTGYAFDITAKRIQTEQANIGSRMRQESYEITFTSAKESDITLWVREKFYGNWAITRSSIPFKKTDSQTAEFEVKLPKSSQTSLTYTVQTKW